MLYKVRKATAERLRVGEKVGIRPRRDRIIIVVFYRPCENIAGFNIILYYDNKKHNPSNNQNTRSHQDRTGPFLAVDVDAADAGVDGGGAGGDKDGMTGGFEPPVLAPPAQSDINVNQEINKGWIAKSTYFPSPGEGRDNRDILVPALLPVSMLAMDTIGMIACDYSQHGMFIGISLELPSGAPSALIAELGERQAVEGLRTPGHSVGPQALDERREKLRDRAVTRFYQDLMDVYYFGLGLSQPPWDFLCFVTVGNSTLVVTYFTERSLLHQCFSGSVVIHRKQKKNWFASFTFIIVMCETLTLLRPFNIRKITKGLELLFSTLQPLIATGLHVQISPQVFKRGLFSVKRLGFDGFGVIAIFLNLAGRCYHFNSGDGLNSTITPSGNNRVG
ncbi:hypothetical protein BYT27DRAFT_7246525 [Phlegmacium glaucopus]|nr:hypothetical protein BYT27DRAFT_7246525 [Phlegmacium glaucopus]